MVRLRCPPAGVDGESLPSPVGIDQKGPQAAPPIVALLREIGERYGKSPAQVALRWLIENECVLPVPGAKNGEQAAENAGALSFRLTRAEIEALDQATMDWRA